MDQLSDKLLPALTGKEKLSKPSPAQVQLPEKVLQFGTGVLLRGLIDHYIDKANKQGLFNGRVVVVKSTPGRPAPEFRQQDNLYTLCIRGLKNGQAVEEYSINASISRVIGAREEWDAVLHCAADPAIQLIISNTTEVGISLKEDDIVDGSVVPVSFPGKLTACLYHRYRSLGATADAGMVILPTELVPDNGTQLKAICTRLAEENQLEQAFIDWLQNANDFCNTLVDCIVPGAMQPYERSQAETCLGYRDELMITSEAYRLWAIETSRPATREKLAFAGADDSIVVSVDIGKFRDLKLRLLNGAHTFSCGLALLSGFETVKEAMRNNFFEKFIQDLMIREIAPTLVGKQMQPEEAVQFAQRVLDRFRNPHIDHRWASISSQYTAKMLMRNIPTLLAYYKRYDTVPEGMAMGFAAYLYFMRSEQTGPGRYFRHCYGKQIPIDDGQAMVLHDKWSSGTTEAVVHDTLSDTALWDADLSTLPGFEEAVIRHLNKLKIQQQKATYNKAGVN